MGDIADAMLDGMLCGECGSYLGDDVGYPRYCGGCGPRDGGGGVADFARADPALEKRRAKRKRYRANKRRRAAIAKAQPEHKPRAESGV